MAPQPYQLIMRTGPTPGKTFDLNKNEITIGRDINNDIVINDAEISRKHARLVSQGGGYVLEDMGSTNGTFINGQRLMGPHMLRPGELILLGENVSLAYESVDYDADATMVGSMGVPSMPPSPRETYNPPAQSYVAPAPPPVSPPVPPPYYSGTVPPGPAEVYEMPAEERRSRTWLYVGCGCLLILLCVVIVGAYAFDSLNLYCTPPFNSFFACP